METEDDIAQICSLTIGQQMSQTQKISFSSKRKQEHCEALDTLFSFKNLEEAQNISCSPRKDQTLSKTLSKSNL